jgi:hypothetical protein
MLKADVVLQQLADNPHVMGVLASGPCTIQHVSKRVDDGPDERADTCPCDRKFAKGETDGLPDADRKLLDLGGGLYVSSPTHTYADLVSDALKQQ